MIDNSKIEIPSAVEMGKKAAAAYDQKQKVREAVKEAIEAAAADGQFCVSIRGKLADPIVNELEGLGYSVISERDTYGPFCSNFNTLIGWREIR